MVAKISAQQLGHPSTLAGRWVLAPIWNRRNRALNDAALAELDLQRDHWVLEVGFGGGYLLGRIAAAATHGRVAGVDVSEAMVEYSRKRLRSFVDSSQLGLCCGAAEALPYPPARFDRLCTINSIFYWHDARQAFAEFGRVLRPGGLLVICFTCAQSIQSKRFARHGLTVYDPRDVREMMTAAGFAEIATRRFADRHREFWCMTAIRSENVKPPAETGPSGF